MFKLAVRVWHYTAAFLTHVFEENADPRIQIEQAIEEAKRHHFQLADSAAAITGHRMELDMKVRRQTDEMRQLEVHAEQAMQLALRARAKGDTVAANTFDRNAERFATEIAARESSIADLREMQTRAAITESAARRAVERNKMHLQKQISERLKMLNDLAAADMQERMVEALKAMDKLAPSGAIPTLPQLQDRLDERIAHSAAQIDTMVDAIRSGSVEVQIAVRDQRGEEILEAIRKRAGLPATTAKS